MFGATVKLGICTDPQNRSQLAEFLHLYSTKSTDEQVSLKGKLRYFILLLSSVHCAQTTSLTHPKCTISATVSIYYLTSESLVAVGGRRGNPKMNPPQHVIDRFFELFVWLSDQIESSAGLLTSYNA